MAATIAPRAAIAAALAALAACGGSGGRSPEIPLRVASFNIMAGGTDLGETVRAIRGMAPDIVGLQEVDVHWSDRSRFEDQATALGTAMGMHVRFAPIYRLPPTDPGRPVREYGVALLSRFPIAEFRNDSLTRHSTQDPNATPARMPGLLNAVVVVNGRRVRLFSTHLDYRADPGVRRTQVNETLRLIRPDEPTVLMGDLNAPPTAPELQPLFRVLADAWIVCGGDGWTYPADKPVKRIDYVLTSSHFRTRAAAVVATAASDHRPIVAELVFRPR